MNDLKMRATVFPFGYATAVTVSCDYGNLKSTVDYV